MKIKMSGLEPDIACLVELIYDLINRQFYAGSVLYWWWFNFHQPEVYSLVQVVLLFFLSLHVCLSFLKLNCCGVIGPNDYQDSLWFNRSSPFDESFVPASCCTIGAEVRDPPVNDRRLMVDTRGMPIDGPQNEENICQMDAIVYRRNPSDKISPLKIRVCIAIAITALLQLLLQLPLHYNLNIDELIQLHREHYIWHYILNIEEFI